MKYFEDSDLEAQVRHIVSALGFKHVDVERVRIVRSRGSKSRRTLARIHALSKIFQKTLGIKAHYVIEVISENFDKLSPEDRTKTIIHELMHIPKTFGGGFRHHRPYVTRRSVDKAYREYRKSMGGGILDFFR
jgi:predicted metallopeptidase